MYRRQLAEAVEETPEEDVPEDEPFGPEAPDELDDLPDLSDESSGDSVLSLD